MNMAFKMKYIDIIAVFSILLVGLLYYLVVLSTPIIFGDEGFYASLARWTAENKIFPKYDPSHETDIWHMPNIKLPLFVLTGSFAWLLAGEAGLKFIIPLFSILSAFLIYIFFKKVEMKKAGLAAALVFLFIPSVVTFGVMSYTESMLGLMFLVSAYFAFETFRTGNKFFAVLAGIFVGFTVLSKIQGVLIGPIILAYFLFFAEKKNWKNLIIIFFITIVVVSPWFFRNLTFFGGFCEFGLGNCESVSDKEISKLTEKTFAGAAAEAGTAQGFIKMGLQNYARFSLGWTIPVLFIFGVAVGLSRISKTNMFLFFWLLAFIIPAFLFQTNSRAEDIQRALMPLYVPIAMFSGIFVADAYDYLKKYHILAAAVFLIIFVSATWLYGQEKLNTMTAVKGQLTGLVEGCKWVKNNTPKDSILFSVYAHQTAYQCNRKTVGNGIPGDAEIMLSNNDNAYNALKEHGFDYVYVQQFTVSLTPYSEAITVGFLEYLEGSSKFKKVFDNTNIYGSGGVRLYQVL